MGRGVDVVAADCLQMELDWKRGDRFASSWFRSSDSSDVTYLSVSIPAVYGKRELEAIERVTMEWGVWRR